MRPANNTPMDGIFKNSKSVKAWIFSVEIFFYLLMTSAKLFFKQYFQALRFMYYFIIYYLKHQSIFVAPLYHSSKIGTMTTFCMRWWDWSYAPLSQHWSRHGRKKSFFRQHSLHRLSNLQAKGLSDKRFFKKLNQCFT